MKTTEYFDKDTDSRIFVFESDNGRLIGNLSIGVKIVVHDPNNKDKRLKNVPTLSTLHSRPAK